jgi:hypothetical protein
MNKKNPPPRRGIFEKLFFDCQFDEFVESGFFSGCGVFMNNILFGGFVQSLNGFFEPLFGIISFAGLHGGAGFFDSAFELTFNSIIFFRVFLGHAHIFLGGFFDGHNFSF